MLMLQHHTTTLNIHVLIYYVPVLFLSLLSSFCSNGYNMVVVSEILGDLRSINILSSAIEEGIFLASINVGIIFMLPLGAYLSDKYGRLRTVIFGESIVVVASILQMFCTTSVAITLSRTCVGFGMAICVLLKPLYIAELSNVNHRGKLLTLFSIAFCTGVLIVSILSSLQTKNRNPFLLLGIGAIPSFVLILAAQFYLVESPVWLKMAHQQQQQQRSSSNITNGDNNNNNDDIDNEEKKGLTTGKMNEDDDEYTQGKCSQVFCELFSSDGLGSTTLTAVLVGLLYEFDGVWMLILYRKDILERVVSVEDVHYFSVLLCAVLLIANIIPMLLIDRAGRRMLLIVGLIGSSCIKFTFATIVASAHLKGWPMGVLLLLWVMFSQVGVSVVCNVVISELFGPRHRSVAMCFVYWVMLTTGFFLSLVYKPVEEVIGHEGWVYIFGVSSIVIGIPVLMRLPETKGTVIGATMK